MSLHPCSHRRRSLQVCLGKVSHRSMPLWTSVFFCGCASNSQDLPLRAIFKWKNLIEPALKPLSEWMKGGESWTQTCTNVCLYVPAWANIAVCQLCRERKTFVEQSWWPELNVFGSMPWCSFPRHIFLPRPAQRNCCLNLIDEFASLFSPKAIFAGSLRKGFPQKHAFAILCGHQCFSMVGQATTKTCPRPAQGLFSNERTSYNN